MSNEHIHANTVKPSLNLYLTIFRFSLEMVQKLAKNNLEYSESMSKKFLDLAEHSSNSKQQDVLAPTQKILTEAIQNNSQLCEDTLAIISEAANKIQAMLQAQPHNFDYSSFKLFNLWNNLIKPNTFSA